MPLPKPKRGKEKPTILLNATDIAILKALIKYHQLTREQIIRMFYSPTSKAYGYKKLRHLLRAKVIVQCEVPSIQSQNPRYYTIATKGINYLALQGAVVPTRFRPSEQQETAGPIYHTIAVNDFAVLLNKLTDLYEGIAIAEFRHEREILLRPFTAEVSFRKVAVRPDGFFALELAGTPPLHLLPEIDRGTEEQKKWREKVRRLVYYTIANYKLSKKGRRAIIPVVVTTSWKRARTLAEWTEKALQLMKAKEYAHVFRFTHLHLDRVTPQEAFLSAYWLAPFGSGELAPLLPLAGGEVSPPSPQDEQCCRLSLIGTQLEMHDCLGHFSAPVRQA